MEPVKVKIPPGMFRNGTEYESVGRWYSGNLVRWESGRIRPWGGWRRVLADEETITGVARGGIAWRSNAGYRHIAIGTNEKLYIGAGGAYTDVTPVDLVTGRVDTVEGPGYGAGPYGAEEYGTPREENVLTLDAATWSFDTHGEDLVGVLSSDGRLFFWSPTLSTDPEVILNSPVDNVGVLVTDEVHIMALGADGNKRKVAWCDQENREIWTAAANNTAGSRVLQTQGNIVAGRKVGTTPLIWTSEDVHAMDYLGPPFIYKNRYVGKGGLAGPNAVAVVNGVARWFSQDGFYIYDGNLRTLPCDVLDYVMRDINMLQRVKIFAGVNAQKGEIIWFYCSANSSEVDRYVVLNYRETPEVWYFGELARTVWVDRGVFSLPIAVTPDGIIFEHDVGYLGDGATRSNIFLQSGPAEIGNGAKIIYSNLMIPDVDVGASAIQLKMKTRIAPMSAETNVGPYSLVPNASGRVPVRIAGKQASMRIEQIVDADWSFGTQRFEVAGGGKR